MSSRRQRLRDRQRHIVRRGLVYSLVLACVILGFGGVGFWMLDPRIKTLSDGLWLSFTTAATVGYGDVVPSTFGSRLFAFVVVLLGLAVLSLVTASLAAIFVEREVDEEERQIERDLLRQMSGIKRDIASLRAEVLAIQTHTSTEELLRAEAGAAAIRASGEMPPPTH
ncbi:potassium channel family protein [Ottowia testudinis]|uniref:Two pore domain potassium channel family protein n=1 Tax=Ottowia testudinis TaxID=2816950 RepID=A0A975CGG8_9BURK|nr:potassium channel family protein [Ottowia testudinis]QTD45114.1 two pore domain potassium channel family protein [Ottowia testudinis]